MPVTEPSFVEIVAGTVEGTIVGVARAISEFKRNKQRPETVLESDGIVVDRIADHTGRHLDQALRLLDKEGRIALDEGALQLRRSCRDFLGQQLQLLGRCRTRDI